jgi:DNA-binding transcriptional ArsR family regulator
VRDRAVEVIGDERASGTSLPRVGKPEPVAEHEVVEEEQGATLEELGEGLLTVLRMKEVVLIDRNPGQLLTPARDLIACAKVPLLGFEQLSARRQPVLAGSGRVLRHRRSSLIGRRVSIVSIMANDPFKALAHPLRRDIVERLSGGAITVGEATRDLGVSKPTISRHLKILEDAGVVTRVIDGRTHRLALQANTLADAAGWLERQRARWERLFDVVGEYLEEDR